MEELISVVVPIYNVEKYLQKCIDSILAQTYRHLEIILVDDGSPDNCGAICDNYAQEDGRVLVIHKKNGGLSSARNAGLEIAKGELIVFIDSDDWIDANYMHISYKPLWHTLLERDMRKEDLRLAAGMTTNMIANMSKEGKHISMDTLARICETLNCEITDVIELVPDEPASTGGKEHERIETKNNGKRN